MKTVRHLLEHYPRKNAALGDVLHLAQEAFGHLSPEVEEYVAGLMELPVSYVHQVVSFYTLYLRKPVGKYHLMLCDNVSCMICGAGELLEHLRKKLGIEVGGTTADGRFTLWTVECLGACEAAPVIMINDKYYGSLTTRKLDELLDGLE
ncbi:MAG: NAD(P)H-dependent oxidoreductase subunit E [Candidatus Glassbacteria bacterium]|nr:NAD(P)H-dependent oxidoreductase subunit E [Candidatus Glassbacteria bacterium]